jgi:hypothetical protein
MVTLILLSMVLSAPSAAAETAVLPGDGLTVEIPNLPAQSHLPLFRPTDEPMVVADPIAIEPESDICYKIRAYIFSTDRIPKLLKETTCGPKRPTAKSVEGFKPRLVPLDVKEKPAAAPER